MKEEEKKIVYNNQTSEILLTKLRQMCDENFEHPMFRHYRKPQNINGRYYKGSNAALLSILCENKGYQTGVFLSHKQIQDEGYRINKGEKSCYLSSDVYMYKNKGNEKEWLSYTEYMNLPEEGRTNYQKILCTKHYPVFNIEQTNFPTVHKESWEMMCERYSIEQNRGESYVSPILHSIIKDQKWVCPFELSTEKESGYSWSQDKIITKPMSTYTNIKDYYDELLMYMSHSTGHSSRLHRVFNDIGDERYRKEYLSSSITSAIVGGELGMQIKPQSGFKTYMENWISEIEKNPSFASDIFKSSAQSQYILNRSIVEVANELASQTQQKGEIKAKTTDIVKTPDLEIPELKEFKKEGDYVYAIGNRPDGSEFKSLIYRRGDEFCYMLGSIIDGNLSTHFLNEIEKGIYKHLRNSKTDSSLLLSEPEKIITETKIDIKDIIVNTSRRSLEIKDNSAEIIYHGVRYDASSIIDTFKKQSINISTIKPEDWKKLLLGQGLQLGNDRKAIFSIKKTPSGYGLRVMNEIIKQDKAELVK